jgi:hypothetical protein
LIQAFSNAADASGEGFTVTGASTFMNDLTPELFLLMTLQENARRMSAFDRRLLQPKLLPRLRRSRFASSGYYLNGNLVPKLVF